MQQQLTPDNVCVPLSLSLCVCCSGEGGAIYAQSASLTVNSSLFQNNYAVTGQLDNGASGGAIVVTHCYPVLLTRSNFTANGGAGYYGTCYCLIAV